MRLSNEQSKSLRLRKSVRTTGVVCLVCFSGMGMVSVAGMLLDPPPNAAVDPMWLAAGFGSFWGAMSLLAVWLLLAYRRGRVTVNEDTVAVRGVVREQRARLSDIESITWNTAPPKNVLQTPENRIKIELLNLEPDDRLWLIRRLQTLPTAEHAGWDLFCVRIAVPLQEESSADVSRLSPEKVSLTRKRWACYFLPTSIVFAVVGVVLSRQLQRPGLLAAPLPIVLLWAYLHFSTPTRGLAAARLQAEPERSRFLRFLLIWCGVAIAANFALTAWNLPEGIKIACYAAGGVIWFSGLMLKAFQFDRLRDQADADRIPAALKAWTREYH